MSLRSLILVCGFIILLSGMACGGEVDVEQLKKQLGSKDLTTKSRALLNLMEISKTNDNARKVLIDQLEKEVALLEGKNEFPSGEGEGRGELFVELLATVASFKDRNTIPILVDSLNTPTGAVRVHETLTSFGDESVKFLLQKLKDPKLGRVGKMNLTWVMVQIARDGNISEKNKQLLREEFIKFLNDKNPFVRKDAIKGLGVVGNSDDIPLVQNIAKKDPFSRSIDASFRGGKKVEKITIYPVREEAEKVLKQLESKN